MPLTTSSCPTKALGRATYLGNRSKLDEGLDASSCGCVHPPRAEVRLDVRPPSFDRSTSVASTLDASSNKP